jgi:3'(2'), 5'-bisphosphate nucleotidase
MRRGSFNMPAAAFAQYLPRILETAQRAGEEILKVYHGTVSVTLKDDRSPLTEADRASHEVITRDLAAMAFSAASDKPSAYLPVLSEEGRNIPYAERGSWEYFWLVDPLDGTKEFIKKNGEFTVNIALIHRTRPVLGVIYIPVTGAYYFAAQGFGTYILLDGSVLKESARSAEDRLNVVMRHSRKLPLTASVVDQPESGKLVIAGSRSHATPELENFVNSMKKTYGEVDFVPAGSSLKFCLVAEGRADVYPRLGPTMEWDTAAGQIIVEEAGGSVLRTDAPTPLRYNKEDLLNPWFVVQGQRLKAGGQFKA